MPVVLRIYNIRFFFYSDEHKPIHVHISGGGAKAKVKIEGEIKLVYNHGFSPKAIKNILKKCEREQDFLIQAWNDYFDL